MKKYYITATVIIIAFFLYTNGTHTKVHSKNSTHKFENDFSEESSFASSSNPSTPNQPKDNITAIEIDNPFKDHAKGEEIRKWFSSRGNFSFLGPEYLNDYRSYDNKTLHQLSDTGDLKAMYILSERADSLEKMREIHWKAALYGSTQAIIEIGSLNEELNFNNLDPATKKQKAMDAFSFYEAAQMRGDWWGIMSSGRSITIRHNINFTPEEKQKIENKAKSVYNELQEQRIKLGLGEFDNSVPDSVIQFYEMILHSQSASSN